MGEPMKMVAIEVGYDSQCAFISMCKRRLAKLPVDTLKKVSLIMFKMGNKLEIAMCHYAQFGGYPK